MPGGKQFAVFFAIFFVLVFALPVYASETASASSQSSVKSPDEVAYLVNEAAKETTVEAQSPIKQKTVGSGASLAIEGISQAISGKLWLVTLGVSVLVASLILRNRNSSYGYY